MNGDVMETYDPVLLYRFDLCAKSRNVVGKQERQSPSRVPASLLHIHQWSLFDLSPCALQTSVCVSRAPPLSVT
ncbi:unnamed protein product [Pleuronectes platessa]|uniref:Uncharacterized protein n=1 Tax=Pleuronectes platessa TaxID=8262 RepID=A0A9N7Y8P1_PLEPL|nr:unnamed protein product [Pleuronectes platessa]